MGPRPKLNFFRIWSCCISNKAEDAGSNMVANIIFQKVKLYLFLKEVMLHIKLKFDDTGSKYFAHRHTLDQGVGSKGQTISFLCNHASTCIPDTWFRLSFP